MSSLDDDLVDMYRKQLTEDTTLGDQYCTFINVSFGTAKPKHLILTEKTSLSRVLFFMSYIEDIKDDKKKAIDHLKRLCWMIQEPVTAKNGLNVLIEIAKKY